MSAIGPTGFALLVWGSVALVLGVFGYLVVVVAREAGTGSSGG